MVAEPWDIGTYQVGNFPVDWSEWNGKFRDTLRSFGKGDSGTLAEVGWRLTGSADLYGEDGRSAFNSITSSPATTGSRSTILFPYDRKHNEKNGENNQDGTDDNHSWNCGVEGDHERSRHPGVAPAVDEELRVLSVVRLRHADDSGRRRVRAHAAGNNNAYCQDNEISWFDWTAAERNRDSSEFFRKAIAMTRRFPSSSAEVLPWQGSRRRRRRGPDVVLARPRSPNWQDPNARTCACSSMRARTAGIRRGSIVLRLQRSLRAAADQAAAARR
jgi:glycogen operon protein